LRVPLREFQNSLSIEIPSSYFNFPKRNNEKWLFKGKTLPHVRASVQKRCQNYDNEIYKKVCFLFVSMATFHADFGYCFVVVACLQWNNCNGNC
ncbi:MAG: hypothetical protein LBJ00_08835, partial [Planctomycetaceae bacterium]|nr:hypothetical protein [Planctomycetaceae bacterium]